MGYISDLVVDLERLHHDACLTARPHPVELAGRLFGRGMDGQWDVFADSVSRYADVLGPQGIAPFRDPAAQRWATVPAAGPGDKDAERWGANYRITKVMERLAELAGDVDALTAVKSLDLSVPYDWLEVAAVYAEAGRHRGWWSAIPTLGYGALTHRVHARVVEAAPGRRWQRRLWLRHQIKVTDRRKHANADFS